MHGIHAVLMYGLLGLLLAGCNQTRYEVYVEPDGQRFERRLSAWHVGSDASELPVRLEAHRLSPEEAGRIGALYGREGFSPGTTLKAHFERAAPDDLRGAGRYLRLDTPLGSLVHYSERVGGSDDLVARFEQVRTAGRRMGLLIAGWFEQELGAAPARPALEEFLETELARDLANLGLTFQLDQGFSRRVVAGERVVDEQDHQALAMRSRAPGGYTSLDQSTSSSSSSPSPSSASSETGTASESISM